MRKSFTIKIRVVTSPVAAANGVAILSGSIPKRCAAIVTIKIIVVKINDAREAVNVAVAVKFVARVRSN